jgi:hypothetical protein
MRQKRKRSLTSNYVVRPGRGTEDHGACWVVEGPEVKLMFDSEFDANVVADALNKVAHL